MIRVVGANPAMDRVSTWPPLVIGGVNRAADVHVMPGGKGLNVARALHSLGAAVTTYGFLGGHVGDAIREHLESEGIEDRHTPIQGATRVCFIVVEPDRPRSTVLNEPGPTVSASEVDRLLEDLRGDCAVGDTVILSGSLPDRVPAGLAGRIVAVARDRGARTIVDSSGAALRAAVVERPWMVKCNRDELAALADVDGSDAWAPTRKGSDALAVMAAAMEHVRAMGVEVMMVTLGAAGVLLADADGVVHVSVPAVKVVNVTGCGDLLLAGVVSALERGDPLRDAAVLGAACGTAAAMHLRPELPPGVDLAALEARMMIDEVEPVVEAAT